MQRRMLTRSILVAMAYGMWLNPAMAQEAEPTVLIATPDDARSHGLEDLRRAVKTDGGVPLPDLSDFLMPGAERDLQALGKMLFWDQSLGSDGQSCASCHYHAGADTRASGVVSPGLLRVRADRQGDIRGLHDAEAVPDVAFDTGGAGATVGFGDFPLVKFPGRLTDAGNGIIEPAAGNSNDAISSPGVTFKRFEGTVARQATDLCTDLADPVFRNIHGQNLRRVPPRNTPTVINAVFNAFNFWDGRANHYFNGQNPFGVMDKRARMLRNNDGTIEQVRIRLPNSSLASQAVGPVLSDFEQSCGDSPNGNARTWPEVGKKMVRADRNGVALRALEGQSIHVRDSLIGKYSRGGSNGANVTYRELIKSTFKPEWWESDERRILLGNAGTIGILDRPAAQAPTIVYPAPVIVDATPEETADEATVTPINDGVEDPALTDIEELIQQSPRFTLMEANFSLFFGLAVQAYEATLVADDSPFDQWMRTGKFNSKFRSSQLNGLNTFVNKGKCSNCHGGPELTNASVRNFQKGRNLIEPMKMGDQRFAIYDNGFYNIGVTPTSEDIARGGKGPSGSPLASSRQLLFRDVLNLDIPHRIIGDNGVPAVTEDEQEPVCADPDGNGKCKGEVLLPAFHRAAVDGAFKTSGLRNIELQGPYFHNGGVATLAQAVEFYDNGGNFCQNNIDDLDPDITPLGLSQREKRDLVNFLVSLTDERVRYRKAPFDHPSLKIPASGSPDGEIRLRSTGQNGAAEPLEVFLRKSHRSLGAMPVDFRCSSQ